MEDMSAVHEVFEQPLRRSRIVSDSEVDAIFVNWQDILQCNRNFLRALEGAVGDTIGDVICQHVSTIPNHLQEKRDPILTKIVKIRYFTVFLPKFCWWFI